MDLQKQAEDARNLKEDMDIQELEEIYCAFVEYLALFLIIQKNPRRFLGRELEGGQETEKVSRETLEFAIQIEKEQGHSNYLNFLQETLNRLY